MDTPSFSRMAELIRAGRDAEAEREFNALVAAILYDATTVRFQHPAFGVGDMELVTVNAVSGRQGASE